MPYQLPFIVDYKPHLGKKIDYGIAFCGTGGIVQYAHIPAYKKADFNIIGCYDQNLETAKKLAAAGKHRLWQKSLADNFANAVIVVETARKAGVKQAINHHPTDNSTEDNLNTLRVDYGAYKSDAENRSVRPSEVQ